MVKVIGPCMSGEARGKFGSILVFKKRLRTNVVSRFFIPRNPKSPDQTVVRTRVKKASARWKSALQSTQEAWKAHAKKFGKVGYNMYCSAFLIYMRDHAEAEPTAPFLP